MDCDARSPFADVVRRLLGEHPLLQHVVQGMDGAQLQSLLLMENLAFVHTIYIYIFNTNKTESNLNRPANPT